MPRFDGLRIAFDFVISKDDDLPLQIRFRVDTGGIYVVDYVRGGLLSTNVRDSTQHFCEHNITDQMFSTTFDPLCCVRGYVTLPAKGFLWRPSAPVPGTHNYRHFENAVRHLSR